MRPFTQIIESTIRENPYPSIQSSTAVYRRPNNWLLQEAKERKKGLTPSITEQYLSNIFGLTPQDDTDTYGSDSESGGGGEISIDGDMFISAINNMNKKKSMKNYFKTSNNIIKGSNDALYRYDPEISKFVSLADRGYSEDTIGFKDRPDEFNSLMKSFIKRQEILRRQNEAGTIGGGMR